MARDAPPLLQTTISTLLRAKLELAVVGLDGSGKTVLAKALRSEEPDLPHDPGAQPTPTIGLVIHKVRLRGIKLSLWDLGGRERFRSDWSRHVRGCDALLFVVDVSQPSRFPEAAEALLRLIDSHEAISTLPLLVIANKIDLLTPAVQQQEEQRGWSQLVAQLRLERLGSHRFSVLGASATKLTNMDKVVRWLILQAHGADLALGPGVEEDAGQPSAAWGWLGRLGASLSKQLLPRSSRGKYKKMGSVRKGRRRHRGSSESTLADSLLDEAGATEINLHEGFRVPL